MTDALGPMVYADDENEASPFGRGFTRAISEATQQKVDAEIRRIIDECYNRAHNILSTKIDNLHTLAKGLLEYETLTGDEIIALLKGIPPVRTPYEEPEPQRGPGPSVPAAGRPRTIGPIAEPSPGR